MPRTVPTLSRTSFPVRPGIRIVRMPRLDGPSALCDLDALCTVAGCTVSTPGTPAPTDGARKVVGQ